MIAMPGAGSGRGKIKATAQTLNAVAKVRGRVMRPALGLAHGRNRSVARRRAAPARFVAEPDSFRLANAIEDRAARASAVTVSGLCCGKKPCQFGVRTRRAVATTRTAVNTGVTSVEEYGPSSLRAAPRCTQLAQLAS